MLFEIHDIILHRLWKAAKAKRDAFMKTTFNSDYTASQYDSYTDLKRDIVKYNKLVRREKLTRRWYMNHGGSIVVAKNADEAEEVYACEHGGSINDLVSFIAWKDGQ